MQKKKLLKELSVKTGFENTLLPWIGRIGILFGVHFSKRLRDIGIHISKEQWIVLKYLNNDEGLSQNDLAAITGRDKATITRLINTMESNGYLRRQICSDDKRVRQIFLEPEGKKLYEKTLPIMEELINQTQQDVKEQDLESVLSVLKKVKINLQNFS